MQERRKKWERLLLTVGIQLESGTASTAHLVTTDVALLAIVGHKPWQE